MTASPASSRPSNVLGPTVRFITPSQTVCNYAGLLFGNLASAFAQGSNGGRWQRITVFEPPEGPTARARFASAPANGGGDAENFLHYNPYPNTAAPGQTRECEAGNEPYAVGQQVIGNVPGQPGHGDGRTSRAPRPSGRTPGSEPAAPQGPDRDPSDQAGARPADLGPHLHRPSRRGCSAC